MHHLRQWVALLAGVFLVLGSIYIVWSGMPINTNQIETNPNATYSLGDVAIHNTAEGCWTTIDGNVYDLTTWVSRHPGGTDAILFLCGIDGTEAFHEMHGTSRTPLAVLALLKIGTLK